MTEEEKKAIEVLIYCLDKTFTGFDKYYFKEDDTSMMIFQAIKIAINLIENQQKEIEELKKDRDKFKKALEEKIIYCNDLEKDLFENCSNYVVSKDKIKAKIEEIDKILERNLLVDSLRDYFKAQKEVLQSLLKEE